MTSYSGERNLGWDEGTDSKLTFPNNTVYTGSFKESLFHGPGTLHYPGVGKFVGEFLEGVAVSGKFFFEDGLEYGDSTEDTPKQSESRNVQISKTWKYLMPDDRRYYREKLYGFGTDEEIVNSEHMN
jgi:MORN repeat